jgi:hypothetical protein
LLGVMGIADNPAHDPLSREMCGMNRQDMMKNMPGY